MAGIAEYRCDGRKQAEEIDRLRFCRLVQVNRSEYFGGQHGTGVLHRFVMEIGVSYQTGCVNDAVYGVKPGLGLINDRLHIFPAGNIAADIEHLAAHGFQRVDPLRLFPIQGGTTDQDQSGPHPFSQIFRQEHAQTAGAAGQHVNPFLFKRELGADLGRWVDFLHLLNPSFLSPILNGDAVLGENHIVKQIGYLIKVGQSDRLYDEF